MNIWQKILDWADNFGKPKKSDGLYPPFSEIVDMLLMEAHKAGLDVGIFEGFRSYERQGELHAKGRTTPGKIVTKAKPGYSAHNFGIAADIVFKENGKWSWAEKHPWDLLGKIGEGFNLEWGGRWKTLKDRPHFQFKTNLNLSQMRNLYKNGGVQKVWEYL